MVAQITIRYLRGARLGDVMQIDTEIESRSDKAFAVGQTVFESKSKKIISNATITNIFVDENGKAQSIDEAVLGLWPDLANAPRKDS